MSRKNCLVKVSGDVVKNEEFLQWIKWRSNEYFLVICVGGGTQINEAFEKAKFPVGKHGPLGRETSSLEEKQLARDVLEKNQAEIQDSLAEIRVHASVVIPVIEVGTVLCHVNGDQYVLSAYNGFDVIYIATTNDRVKNKQGIFSKYGKIEVIGF